MSRRRNMKRPYKQKRLMRERTTKFCFLICHFLRKAGQLLSTQGMPEKPSPEYIAAKMGNRDTKILFREFLRLLLRPQPKAPPHRTTRLPIIANREFFVSIPINQKQANAVKNPANAPASVIAQVAGIPKILAGMAMVYGAIN